MKRKLSSLLVYLFSMMLLAISSHSMAAHMSSKLNQQQALMLGTDAYVYGYPLVTMDMTRRVMTNFASSSGVRGAPMGQFFNARTYPDPAFKDVTAPNADTLYSIAWVNLSTEPYILHIPNENDRYYLMPILDGWTNVFADPGKRTTGTGEQNIVIVGPNWEGPPLPSGLTIIHSPTNLIWIIGRTYCTGTAEDYKAVHHIQDQYTLVPLSAYGKNYSPPLGKVDPNIEMKTPVRDQVNQMDAATFFKRLAELLKENPPAVADAPMIEKLAKLGVVPGKVFDMSKLDSEEAIGLTAAVSAAQEKIMAHYYKAGVEKNHWSITKNTGTYGTDYVQRALMAAIGLGANLPQDAIYPITKLDQDGIPLNGTNKYIMHFNKGQLPPVNGFWSLTMYDNEYFFVKNSLNRYSINPRDNFQYNEDGSLDIYIQHVSPGKDKESNWLPAPEEAFILMLRLYWPKEAILDGAWVPPGVQHVKSTG